MLNRSRIFAVLNRSSTTSSISSSSSSSLPSSIALAATAASSSSSACSCASRAFSSVSAIPTLFGARRFSNAQSTEAAAAAGNAKSPPQSSKATVPEQQTEQEEYNDILAAAAREQQKQSAVAAPASQQAKLLVYAHPKIFSELVTAKSDPARRKLCEKHLLVDSPELFRWQCSACSKEWTRSVVERALFDAACPHCKAASDTTQSSLLQDQRPELVAEISSEAKNDPFLDAESIGVDDKRRIWWTCKGCGCDYQARVVDRVKGKRSCPRCNVAQSEFVADRLRREWHPTKNGDLDPSVVLLRSEKKQVVWWLCSTCTHEWPARVSTRFSGSGCPGCISRSPTSISGGLGGGGGMIRSTEDAHHLSAPLDASDAYKVKVAKLRIRQQQNEADMATRMLTHTRNSAAHEKMNAVLKQAALMSQPSSSTAMNLSREEQTGDGEEDEDADDDAEGFEPEGKTTELSSSLSTSSPPSSSAVTASSRLLVKEKKFSPEKLRQLKIAAAQKQAAAQEKAEMLKQEAAQQASASLAAARRSSSNNKLLSTAFVKEADGKSYKVENMFLHANSAVKMGKKKLVSNDHFALEAEKKKKQ